MTAPNMAAITASLERSLQSFSLNHHQSSITINASEGLGFGRSSSSSSESQNNSCHTSRISSDDASLELNSNITLPYHWEQCLDLKTGEVYYINWRTGMKSKEDPRMVDDGFSGYFYSDEEEEEEEEGEESSYGSGGSSVESSPAASSSRKQKQNEEEEEEEEDDEDEDEDEDEEEDEDENASRIGGHVLVVAGCKGCFMYFMVPKQVEECPKCCGQLLHFDRSDDNA